MLRLLLLLLLGDMEDYITNRHNFVASCVFTLLDGKLRWCRASLDARRDFEQPAKNISFNFRYGVPSSTASKRETPFRGSNCGFQTVVMKPDFWTPVAEPFTNVEWR
jgi:hypothetical protein